jgi:TonB family protein
VRRLPPGATPVLLVALLAAVPRPGAAQDPPPGEPVLTAGTDVAAPKRTKFVAPAYPPEAQAQGLRGIVILELVINEQGKVASADVIRSVPPFDEAALAAVRTWEYEVTKVDGKPVRVRLTVPITFALRLPEIRREEGIPELRQGGTPGFPAGAQGPAKVVAEVRLLPDGSVAEASIKAGVSPWAEALLQALRTWRFAWEGEGSISFDVEAEFGAAAGTAAPRVELKLSGLKRQEAAAAPGRPVADGAQPPGPGPAPVATPEPAASPSPDAGAPAPEAPRDAPATPPPSAPPAPGPAPDVALTLPSPSPAPEAPQDAPGAPSPTPPPVEVISGGPLPSAQPATPPPPPQAGLSSVRDVNLAVGVPDLTKGRRPVVPPLARLSGVAGTVEVDFAVDAAGGTSVQEVRGPDALKEAARQTVASWAFRRTTPERLFLKAVLTYERDLARADVAARAE